MVIVLKAESVKAWNSKLALESLGTARQYLSHLSTYWVSSLSKNYATIDQWVDQVRKEQDGDIKVRRKWGSDLCKIWKDH